MSDARERGSISVLLLGYVLIVLALLVVVVDASSFYLARRSLSALADGAALDAASVADVDAVYAGRLGGDLPLDAASARAEVVRYLSERDLAGGAPGLRLVGVATDGVTVSVALSEDKPLPFLGMVSRLTGAFAGGTAPVSATASARAPVTG